MAGSVCADPLADTVNRHQTVLSVETFGRFTTAGLQAWTIVVGKTNSAVTILADFTIFTVLILGTAINTDLVLADSSTDAVDIRDADSRFIAFAETYIAGLVAGAVIVICAVWGFDTTAGVADLVVVTISIAIAASDAGGVYADGVTSAISVFVA